MYMYMYMYIVTATLMYCCVYTYPPGTTKVILNKVKADLETAPKDSFTEEEMAEVG